MPKTPIQMLDTVLELGADALEAYQNPHNPSGLNANAAGGIFSNLISRHGITPTTLKELRETLAPIGVILAEEYTGTEEAALDMIAKLKEAHPGLFTVPDADPEIITGLNEEIALLRAEIEHNRLAASFAEDGSIPPVPEGATTFTPMHALVSALVDAQRDFTYSIERGDDMSPEQIAVLLETVEGALNINSEVAAIAAGFREALTEDDEEDESEDPIAEAIAEGNEAAKAGEVQTGFTERTEPTVLSEAKFDDAPGVVLHDQGSSNIGKPQGLSAGDLDKKIGGPDSRRSNQRGRSGRGRGR